VLYFWVPDELRTERDGVAHSVRAALELRLPILRKGRRKREGAGDGEAGDDE
jgi:hypothetical protein